MAEIMRAQHYRLISEILAISTTTGRPEMVTIPANATVTVVYGPFRGTRFVDVIWDNETCMVFKSDLEAHAKRVEP